LVAGLEEFITQGVLKEKLGGWIVPTVLAFAPFLLVFLGLRRMLCSTLSEAQAAIIYYFAAGFTGLLFEWVIMGLCPWKDPQLLQIPFQIGMFSFWGTVALAPCILLEARPELSRVRRFCFWLLLIGFVLIYVSAFTLPRRDRFAAVLGAVLLTFILMNGVYLAYFRVLRQQKCSSPGSH